MLSSPNIISCRKLHRGLDERSGEISQVELLLTILCGFHWDEIDCKGNMSISINKKWDFTQQTTSKVSDATTRDKIKITSYDPHSMWRSSLCHIYLIPVQVSRDL